MIDPRRPETIFDMANKITEAYKVIHGLPVERRYTDAELAEPMQRVRESAAMLAPAPEAASGVNEL